MRRSDILNSNKSVLSGVDPSGYDVECRISSESEIDEVVEGTPAVSEDDLDDYYNDLAEVWIKVDGLEDLVHNHKTELFNAEKIIYKLNDDVKGIKIALAGVLSIQILLSAICFVKRSLTQKRGKVI